MKRLTFQATTHRVLLWKECVSLGLAVLEALRWWLSATCTYYVSCPWLAPHAVPSWETSSLARSRLWMSHLASVLVGIVTGFPSAITLFSILYSQSPKEPERRRRRRFFQRDSRSRRAPGTRAFDLRKRIMRDFRSHRVLIFACQIRDLEATGCFISVCDHRNPGEYPFAVRLPRAAGFLQSRAAPV
jgi:hypothetical protein